MADNPGMSIRPAEVNDVTNQLHGLAGRLQDVLKNEAPNLMVTASGRDEVSQRVASTLNDVHQSFSTSADKGVGELHDVAAAVNAHSNNVVAVDQGYTRN